MDPTGRREELGGQVGHGRLRGALEIKCAKAIVFYCRKWRGRLFRVDKTRATLNVYRATFQVGAPKDAVLYIAGLGYASVWVNGMAVPKMRLVTSPWTQNERLIGFSAIDVLPMLKPNTKNTITVGLGSGWRDQAKFPNKDNDLKGDATHRG